LRVKVGIRVAPLLYRCFDVAAFAAGYSHRSSGSAYELPTQDPSARPSSRHLHRPHRARLRPDGR
jgi:hypothetical protein